MNDENWNRFWKHGDTGVTPTRKNLFKIFAALDLPRNSVILDVGCGSGNLAKFWKDQGYNVTGVDISDESLKLTKNKNVHCIKGDVTKKLPFQDHSFDLVYSDGLLEHFVDPKPILNEIFRVSNNFVLTLVPRRCLYVNLVNAVFRPPTEYKKKDNDWIDLHKCFNPVSLENKIVRYGILLILCKKNFN